MWNKVLDFLASELYFKIAFICFIAGLLLIGICKVLEEINIRKTLKEFEVSLKKFGIPTNFEAPDYVWFHIRYLIEIAEKYELDSLYEAQDKFDELHTVYWSSKRVSDEEMKLLQEPCSDVKEFVLRAKRHGEALERPNFVEMTYDSIQISSKLEDKTNKKETSDSFEEFIRLCRSGHNLSVLAESFVAKCAEHDSELKKKYEDFKTSPDYVPPGRAFKKTWCIYRRATSFF